MQWGRGKRSFPKKFEVQASFRGWRCILKVVNNQKVYKAKNAIKCKVN